ncbi:MULTISPECIES: hypothetical protein [unclassified Archaeoglobus]|jgi:hypothetical protein|uniref:hypothetical protein n=1 Tax=unclassified Archaeoglobus TaxID=2643606 RepID=UPI0025BB22A5|nr:MULTISPECIES: hypothetical protein [unclassified Archaeoglobus]
MVSLKKLVKEIKEIIPSFEELAEVVDPLYRGEAFYSSSSISAFRAIEKKDLYERATPEKITDGEHFELISPPRGFEISEVSVKDSEVRVKIDFVNSIFADVMRVMCNVGLMLIVLFSMFYFAGINPSDNLNLEVQKWSNSASTFWKEVKGIDAKGYSWFLTNLLDPENDIILSVVLLALTPVVGLITAIPRASGMLRIIFLIITIEFVYAIFRVLISQTPAGH